MHRDLKPENIMLEELPANASQGGSGGEGAQLALKVVDYGTSVFCTPGQKLHDTFGVKGAQGSGCGG